MPILIPFILAGLGVYGIVRAARVRASATKTTTWAVVVPPSRLYAATHLVESNQMVDELNALISLCAFGRWSGYTVNGNTIIFEFKYEGAHGNLQACFDQNGGPIIAALEGV